MPKYVFRKSRAKKVTKRLPYKRRSTKTTTNTIKRIVKMAIARNVENKTAQVYSIGQDIYPSNHASFNGSIIPVSPYPAFLAIAQGTSEGSRIGNKIKIKRVSLKGVVFPKPYNATTNAIPQPQQIIMWLLYDKLNSTIIPTIGNDFLQLGSSSTGLFGELVDTWAPVNSDRWKVLTKRVFKIGYAENLGTGTTPGSANFANNDFKLNQTFKIDCTKYLVKNVKYNDNNTAPTTRGLFWVFTTVAANGAVFGSTTVPAELQYSLDCSYEDA